MTEENGTAQDPQQRRTVIIVAVVVLVLLLCCCLFLIAGWFYGDTLVNQFARTAFGMLSAA